MQESDCGYGFRRCTTVCEYTFRYVCKYVEGRDGGGERWGNETDDWEFAVYSKGSLADVSSTVHRSPPRFGEVLSSATHHGQL